MTILFGALLASVAGAAPGDNMNVVRDLAGRVGPIIGSALACRDIARPRIQVIVDKFTAVDLGVSFSGPGYTEFKTNLDAVATQFPAAPTYSQRGATLHLYDGIIQAALAMDETKSTDPTVYNSVIKDVGNGVAGAVTVNTYATAVAAVNSGQKVHWVGAGGLTNYNQYNNSQQGYILVKYDATGNEITIGTLSQAQTASIIAAGGG